MITVQCGNGQQKIEWLGDTACHRFDSNYLWDVGTVQDIRLSNGVMVNMKGTVSEELQDDVHIYVQLLGKCSKIVKTHSNFPHRGLTGSRSGRSKCQEQET